MLQFIKSHKLSVTVITLTTALISCANMGQGPQGGRVDLNPPRLMKSTPALNQTNFKGNKIELIFDENVDVKDKSNKVIITPPQKRMPVIVSANKKVTIELRDTLKENTTYTIDFTDAIQDNNENNPLENFSLSFSTGDVVDSLTISGKVIQAEDNEFVKGYYVGLHSNLEDTAFTKTPFERISRTNDRGEFTIRGVAPGKYRLFALDDKNRDYMYDNPMEALAFYDVILEPTSVGAVRNDTIYADEEKTVLDTVKVINYTRFLPDDIVMKSFLSERRREYFRNAERKEARKFVLNFGTTTNEPKLEPLNFDPNLDWVVKDRNIARDSVYTYWIKDESIMAMDTLLFNFTFNMTDTLDNLVTKTDTLRVISRERKDDKKKKKKKDDEEEEIVLLEIKSNIKSSWDIYDKISIEFNEPIRDSLRSLISFQKKVDTLYHDTEFDFSVDSLNPRKFEISRKWKYGEQFKISIDSAAVHSIYGLWNGKWEQTFTVKTEDQYGHVAVRLTGVNDTIPLFMELLDSSGKPLRKASVIDDIAIFKNVNPGKYFTRLIMDRNGNKQWDTGDYETKRQPEDVYYYPGSFEVRAYWEDELLFEVDPLSFAKPEEIMKNKPEDKEAREKRLMERDSKAYEEAREEQRRQEELQDPTGRTRMRNERNRNR